MEDIVFQIYGTFILTLAGFVLPVIAIALSAFPEGVKALRENYENQQKQSEENLREELKKKKIGGDIDYAVLVKNIKKLKSQKEKAESRLQYLNPVNILSKSAFAIGVSAVSFLLGTIFYLSPYYVAYTLFLISVLSVVWAIVIFFNSIGIIIEASFSVQNIQRTTNEKIIELLSTIADNTNQDVASLFINPKDIEVFFHDEEVFLDKEYSFAVGKKQKIKISFTNLSSFMLKTVELGFIFPSEVLIEGKSTLNIQTSDEEKIIRFKHDHIQSKVHQQEGFIEITFLKTGIFDILAFVKGENLKRKSIEFKVKVVE